MTKESVWWLISCSDLCDRQRWQKALWRDGGRVTWVVGGREIEQSSSSNIRQQTRPLQIRQTCPGKRGLFHANVTYQDPNVTLQDPNVTIHDQNVSLQDPKRVDLCISGP